MAKRKRIAKRTPEEQAAYDERTRMIEERIAFRRRVEAEAETRGARKSLARRLLDRLRLAA